ncbi:MAG: NepR family anti-sigma factor [Pseudomonadota bacterium]
MDDTDARRPREDIIDANLKRVYEEAVEEGVPDRFRDLLDALRAQEQNKGSCK